MISEVVASWISRLNSSVNLQDSGLFLPVLVSVFIIALPLLLWRIWTFTILPILRPDEPKQIPYWVPILGHAITFFRNSHGIINYGREYLGNSREPFALTVAGETLYVLTSPRDTTEAYKNTTSLSFDGFVRDLMLACGGSPSGVDKMYQKPASDGSGHVMIAPNPMHKCLANLTVDFHKQQLLPGDELDKLGIEFLRIINEHLQWERMTSQCSYVVKASPDEVEVSLHKWCGDILVDAGTRAYFGKRLLQIDPHLLHSFFEYDDKAWMLLFQYPHFLSKDMYAAKQRIIDALTMYFKLPKEQRQDEAWFIHALEREQRALGMSDQDVAALLMIVYWAINTNTFKLCFWMLAYLLQDSSLLSSIRAEVMPGVANGTPDIHHLMDHCPRLEAVFHEVLRLTASSASFRHVQKPTVIAGKTLRGGTKLIIPYRQLHYNEDVYGSNVSQFDPERFFQDKDLSRSSSYRPFGGGSTYCPGRFIARQEVVTFIGLVLGRFDIELASRQSVGGKHGLAQFFPELEEAKPCLGVMGPAKEGDLVVRVRPSEGKSSLG